MKPVAFALAVSCAAAAAMAEPAGLRIAELALPHHGAVARAALWYPASGGDAPMRYAENPVFVGVDAMRDAAVAEGAHPLVLLSHGMGGTDRAMAWLASALAERGAIVVALNHPGSTWGDFDMTRGVRHWTRAWDLSAALDAVLADPAFAGRIDAARIMAAGFSFGGWTALSVGGARGNHAGIVAACAAQPAMEACDVLMSDAVRMQDVDPAMWNAAYADPRVTHVAAIDPGFVWGLDAADVGALAPESVVIGLGDSATRMLATDFDQSGLASLLVDAQITRLAPAVHFTAMPLCKPEGAAVLAAENDDPVCTDPEGGDRAAIHAGIVQILARRLGL